MAKVKNINNVNLVIEELKNSSLDNKLIHIAILCCIAKESNFELKEEKGYGSTSNERILKIFGKRLPKKYHENEALLNQLKKNKQEFFNLVYANRGGNKNPGDGYLYRGRGFNQLTFRGNYKIYSDDEYNLVKHPELLMDPKVAAQVVVKFFIRQIKKNKPLILKRFNIDSIDTIDDLEKAILIIVNLNAGFGKTIHSSTVQRAFKHALEYKKQMIELYN